MRIIIPTFERIEWMPPTIDLLRKLDAMGHEIVCITVFPSKYLKEMHLRNVSNVALSEHEYSLVEKIPYIRGISGILYRVDNLIKHMICSRLEKVLDAELKKGGVLWIVNEMTVLLAGSNFLKNRRFAFTIYELHEKKWSNKHIERAARKAKVVVVPEYCRAHIMKSRYSLSSVPVVLPNKSDIPTECSTLSHDAQIAIKKLKKMKEDGQIILAYMGGINRERPLDGVLCALKSRKQVVLAVIGGRTSYLSELEKKYPDQLVYIGGFLPPEHLFVARHAHIGLLNYVSINQNQGLNAIFCAPNKIYEYTGLGLPVMGNDIPGLRFDIERSKCGEIVDYNDGESILHALDCIMSEYSRYSENAYKFYNSIDTQQIVSNIVYDLKADSLT